MSPDFASVWLISEIVSFSFMSTRLWLDELTFTRVFVVAGLSDGTRSRMLLCLVGSVTNCSCPRQLASCWARRPAASMTLLPGHFVVSKTLKEALGGAVNSTDQQHPGFQSNSEPNKLEVFRVFGWTVVYGYSF